MSSPPRTLTEHFSKLREPWYALVWLRFAVLFPPCVIAMLTLRECETEYSLLVALGACAFGSAAFGALDVWMALAESWPRASRLKFALFVAILAIAPFATAMGGVRIGVPDRVFLWRHRGELDAIVRDPYGAHPLPREIRVIGSCTVIAVGDASWFDWYWLIHDARASGPKELRAKLVAGHEGQLAHSFWHVSGPWYAGVK